ncbi:hypothetical protein Taro_020229, partial [Colocasia esculenta]|nr:hypothetical protein [Colocasia esculenta]
DSPFAAPPSRQWSPSTVASPPSRLPSPQLHLHAGDPPSPSAVAPPLSGEPPPRRWSDIPLYSSAVGIPSSASTAHRYQPPVDIHSVAGHLLPASASTAAIGIYADMYVCGMYM